MALFQLSVLCLFSESRKVGGVIIISVWPARLNSKSQLFWWLPRALKQTQLAYQLPYMIYNCPFYLHLPSRLIFPFTFHNCKVCKPHHEHYDSPIIITACYSTELSPMIYWFYCCTYTGKHMYLSVVLTIITNRPSCLNFRMSKRSVVMHLYML